MNGDPVRYVDPLGLSAMNGCDTKKRVEALREKYAHLTPTQRSARLEQLAEANAYRHLQELESSIPGAHFLQKHGAHTSMEAQLDRATTGRNPTTGRIDTYGNGRPSIPTAATKFYSHRDQWNIIQRAQHILDTTGRIIDAQKPISSRYIIGGGYQRGTLDYADSYTSVVYFNENKQPKTAFPQWGI